MSVPLHRPTLVSRLIYDRKYAQHTSHISFAFICSKSRRANFEFEFVAGKYNFIRRTVEMRKIENVFKSMARLRTVRLTTTA